MKIFVAIAVALLSVHWAANAEEGTLLKGKDVTEDNLLKALTPDAAPQAEMPSEAASGITTRQIKLTPTAAPAKKHTSALLLITFETNSAVLTGSSKEQLTAVGAALKNDKLKSFDFTIEGHADARGSAAANQTLSQRRADSVRRYLIDVQNVAESRLQAIGKGSSEPLNLQNVSAAENRRVTITTLSP